MTNDHRRSRCDWKQRIRCGSHNLRIICRSCINIFLLCISNIPSHWVRDIHFLWQRRVSNVIFWRHKSFAWSDSHWISNTTNHEWTCWRTRKVIWGVTSCTRYNYWSRTSRSSSNFKRVTRSTRNNRTSCSANSCWRICRISVTWQRKVSYWSRDTSLLFSRQPARQIIDVYSLRNWRVRYRVCLIISFITCEEQIINIHRLSILITIKCDNKRVTRNIKILLRDTKVNLGICLAISDWVNKTQIASWNRLVSNLQACLLVLVSNIRHHIILRCSINRWNLTLIVCFKVCGCAVCQFVSQIINRYQLTSSRRLVNLHCVTRNLLCRQIQVTKCNLRSSRTLRKCGYFGCFISDWINRCNKCNVLVLHCRHVNDTIRIVQQLAISINSKCVCQLRQIERLCLVHKEWSLAVISHWGSGSIDNLSLCINHHEDVTIRHVHHCICIRHIRGIIQFQVSLTINWTIRQISLLSLNVCQFGIRQQWRIVANLNVLWQCGVDDLVIDIFRTHLQCKFSVDNAFCNVASQTTIGSLTFYRNLVSSNAWNFQTITLVCVNKRSCNISMQRLISMRCSCICPWIISRVLLLRWCQYNIVAWCLKLTIICNLGCISKRYNRWHASSIEFTQRNSCAIWQFVNLHASRLLINSLSWHIFNLSQRVLSLHVITWRI